MLIVRLVVAAVCTIPVFCSTIIMLYRMPAWLQLMFMLPIVGCGPADFPQRIRGQCASFAGNERTVSLGTVFAFLYSCVVTFAPQILPENAREPYS